MATYTWTTSGGSGVTGDWATPSDWLLQGGGEGPPGSADTAVISASGNYTITINNNENDTVTAVSLNAAGADLAILGSGTLNLLGTLTATLGSVDLTGTLIGGTVVDTGATLIFDTNTTTQMNATLDDVTWKGPMTLASGANLNILGGLTVETAAGGLPGTINMTAGGASLFVLDGETLNNETLAFGGNGGDALYNFSTAGSTALTLGANFTLTQSGGSDFLVDDSTNSTGFVNEGNVTLTGGELLVIGSTLNNGGTISGSGGGTVGLASIALTNSGLINAQAGGLVQLGSITSNTGTIEITGAGTLELSQSAAANVTLTGTGGDLLVDVTNYAGTISGLALGDSQTVDFTTLTFGNTTTATLNTSKDTLTVKETVSGTVSTATLSLSGSYTGDTFHLAADPNGGTDLTIACFASGTRIATEDGETPVESLRPGDLVRTVLGGAAPVVWIGYRHIDCERHSNPALAWPVRVAPDAFGAGQPARDLYLSPDHAVYMSGALVPIRLLINGTTIRQVELPTTTYYHVELGRHDVVLADGLPAETYLDTGNRVMFENGGGPVALHPDFGVGQAAREAGSCVPFMTDPAQVETLWRALATRSEELGWRLPAAPLLVDDPDLYILVGSRRLKPSVSWDGRYNFVLPAGGEPRFLVSRTARPCDSRPWVGDHRRLGVRVRRLIMRCGLDSRVVAMDEPTLGQGWWAVEWDGTTPCRWTSGQARLPNLGSGVLEVELDATMTYPVDQAGARDLGTSLLAA